MTKILFFLVKLLHQLQTTEYWILKRHVVLLILSENKVVSQIANNWIFLSRGRSYFWRWVNKIFCFNSTNLTVTFFKLIFITTGWGWVEWVILVAGILGKINFLFLFICWHLKLKTFYTPEIPPSPFPQTFFETHQNVCSSRWASCHRHCRLCRLEEGLHEGCHLWGLKKWEYYYQWYHVLFPSLDFKQGHALLF